MKKPYSPQNKGWLCLALILSCSSWLWSQTTTTHTIPFNITPPGIGTNYQEAGATLRICNPEDDCGIFTIEGGCLPFFGQLFIDFSAFSGELVRAELDFMDACGTGGTKVQYYSGGTLVGSQFNTEIGENETLIFIPPSGNNINNMIIETCEARVCELRLTFETSPPPPSFSVSLQAQNVTCNGDSNGSATANPANGTAPFTYQWSNGQNGQTISDVSGDFYSVTVADAGNNLAFGSITVSEPSQILVTTENIQAATCNEKGSLEIKVINRNEGAFSIQWNNGQTTNTLSNLNPGNYRATITDNSGCTTTHIEEIQDLTTPPIADAGPDKFVTCAEITARLDGTGTPIMEEITFVWLGNPGASILEDEETLTPRVRGATIYFLRVTNNLTGCITTDEVEVIEDMDSPTANGGPNKTLGCRDTAVILEGQNSSVGAIFTYKWSADNGGTIFSGENGSNPLVKTAGTYTLTVTNTRNGCTDIDVVQVTKDETLPAADAGPNQALDCETGEVVLTAIPPSGGRTYFYQWFDINGTMISTDTDGKSIPVSETGTYILEVTDVQNGCSALDQMTVFPAQPFTVQFNADQPQCNDDTTTVTAVSIGGTPPFTYRWNIGATTSTINNVGANTYTVTITDGTGCTGSNSISLNPQDNEPPSLTVESTITAFLSVDGTVTVFPQDLIIAFSDNCSGQGGEGGDITIETESRTFGCEDIGEQTLLISVRDEAGNVNSAEVTLIIVDNSTPELVNVPPDTLLPCGTAYTPVLNADNIRGNCFNDFNILTEVDTLAKFCENAYRVEYKWTVINDAEIIITASSMVEFFDNTPPVFSDFVEDITISCDSLFMLPVPQAADNCSGTVVLTFTEVDTFLICQGNNMLFRTWAATDACQNRTEGTQFIQVIDFIPPVFINRMEAITISCDSTHLLTSPEAVDNCSANVRVTSTITRDSFICAGNSIQEVIWSALDDCGNSTSFTQIVQIIDRTPPIFGEYPQALTFPCDSSALAFQPPVFDNCITSPDLQFTDQRTDGECPNSYQINRTWIATDECGNSATSSQIIDFVDNIPPQFGEMPVFIRTTCDSIPEDNLIITDNCSENVSYLITVDSLPSDSGYVLNRTIIATDECGNSAQISQTLEVVDREPPVWNCPSDPIIISSCTTPAKVEYDQPFIEYECSDSVFISFTGIGSGGFFPESRSLEKYVAIDRYGNLSECIVEIDVQELGVLSANLIVNNLPCMEAASGEIIAEVQGGIPPFTYLWNTGTTEAMISNLSPGVYSVEIVDSMGCKGIDSVQLDFSSLELTVDSIVVENETGSVFITVVGGISPYAYSWQNADGEFITNDKNPSNLPESIYTVIISDENGCSQQFSVELDLSVSISEAELEHSLLVSPNPFHHHTLVQFDLSERSEISIYLFDFMGRKVKDILSNEFLLSGQQQFVIEASGMKAGVYQLVIMTDSNYFSRKLMLMNID